MSKTTQDDTVANENAGSKDGRRKRRALMATSALVGVVALSNPSAAWAQATIIDGGAVEVVDGSGDGTSGTKPSPWNLPESLIVGWLGDGELTITNGGSVTADSLTTAGLGTMTGTVNIIGPGSSLTIDNVVELGGAGVGNLTISDGATLSSRDGFLGYNSVAVGTAVIEGENSTWSVLGDLTVGIGGTGSVTLSDGGRLSADRVFLASLSGSSATLNIGAASGADPTAAGILDTASLNFGAGTGSLVFNHTDTDYVFSTFINGSGSIEHLSGDTTLTGTVLHNGSVIVNGGTLTFANGGRYQSTGFGSLFIIGDEQGDDGVVVVDGTVGGSTFDFNNFMSVGNSGSGQFTVTGGADTSINSLSLGYWSGSTGTLIVEGIDSSLTSPSTILVGVFGTGSLTVRDGATLTAGIGIEVGFGAGSSGSVVVDGPGSSIVSADSIFLGGQGEIQFSILNGGSLSTPFSTRVGNSQESTATVLIDGMGSTWTAQRDFDVGLSGLGSLTISSGGLLDSGRGSIGRNAGGNGEATVTGSGSTWILSDVLFVGETGDGSLSILDGGVVTSAAASIADGGFFESDTATGEVWVDGVGSRWSADDLTIGGAGTGTLSITSGGIVENRVAILGEKAGSTGAASVDGEGSNWTNDGDLYVGYDGTGSLAITDGGSVSDITGYVGYGDASSGTVTVDGEGSNWFNNFSLFVGFGGTGSLAITEGGTVSSAYGTVGTFTGSEGTVTVDGEGSSWTNAIELNVGFNGSGSLSITNGGSAVSTNGFVGFNPGSNGVAVVDGEGSSWANSENLYVGSGGSGSLTITDGGSVSSLTGFLGVFNNSQGEVSVDGEGSSWTNSGNLFVGFNTPGALTVSNGGLVEANSLSVAYNPGSSGTVNIGGAAGETATGAGAFGIASGALDFGAGAGTLVFNHTDEDYTFDLAVRGAGTLDHDSGETVLTGANTYTGATTIDGGTLVVGDGGTINGTSMITIAAGADDAASLIVRADNGGGTVSTIGDLYVGSPGSGSLAILDGGQVSNALGFVSRGSTVTVDGVGSTWANSSRLSVGFSENGSLVISNGGSVSSTEGVIGYWPNAIGTVTVDGAGSSWTNDEDLIIGFGGTGVLNIASGGEVTSQFLTLGSLEGSEGSVVIEGAGSTLTNSIGLYVGSEGSGQLSILDGGMLTSAIGEFGGVAGSDATVLVDGAGSSLVFDSQLAVGRWGQASVTVSNGATLSNEWAVIGEFDGGAGSVTIDGQGSQWLNADTLFVGGFGAASADLTVSNGGKVDVEDGNGVIVVANAPGSSAEIRIGAAADEEATGAGTIAASAVVFGSGEGELVFNHTSSDYLFSPTVAGSGSISHLAGQTTLSGDSGMFSGNVDLHGGSLTLSGTIGGTMSVRNGAVLNGTGTLGSLTLENGGIIAPGNSIGTLTVTGDASFAAGSVYQVEVDPTGSSSDLIAISGSATITGGTVSHIGLPGTYGPTSSYTILTAQGGVTGQFDGATSDFLFLDPLLAYSANAVRLTLQRNDIDFSAVAITDNQEQAADAADTFGFGNPVYDRLVVLGADDARMAFDSLSGEIHAGARNVLHDESRLVRRVVLNRLGRNGGGSAAWAEVIGNWGRNYSSDGVAGLDRETKGIIGGAQFALSPAVALGFAGGYTDTDADMGKRLSNASSETYHLLAYANVEADAVNLRGGVGYSRGDISTQRRVLFPGFDESLSANYDSRTLQAFVEAGYEIAVDEGSIEPFMGLSIAQYRTDAFQEAGGASAVSSDQLRTTTSASILGAHLVTSPLKSWQLAATIGWKHLLDGTDNRVGLMFDNGAAMSIIGSSKSRDAALLDATLNVQISDTVMANATYYGELGNNGQDHAVTAGLRIAF